MKVLILSSFEMIKRAEKIKALCRQFGSDSSLYRENGDPEIGLSSYLVQNDLIIIVWDDNSMNNPEIVFSIGYFTGLKKPFVIFGNKKVPSCNGKAVLISSKEELRIFIMAEIRSIKKKKIIKAAKTSILEMGYELSVRDLVEVVSEGENLVLEQFLKAGYLPDSLDKNGVSLLNIAIRKGHVHIASILMDNGVDINCISGDRGNTPLMDAAAEANTEFLVKLIKAGADLNLKSKSGQTALVLSVGRKVEASAIILIKSGADINIKDDLGMTAKKYAELFKLEKVLLLMNNEKK